MLLSFLSHWQMMSILKWIFKNTYLFLASATTQCWWNECPQDKAPIGYSRIPSKHTRQYAMLLWSSISYQTWIKLIPAQTRRATNEVGIELWERIFLTLDRIGLSAMFGCGLKASASICLYVCRLHTRCDIAKILPHRALVRNVQSRYKVHALRPCVLHDRTRIQQKYSKNIFGTVTRHDSKIYITSVCIESAPSHHLVQHENE